mmetsp:Transcript_11040/g.15195  ORF Transcript_11040/g.15195 Transcript_11040/m.15195 type:complete len:371 (+) Transcript_11040:52-1164(+)
MEVKVTNIDYRNITLEKAMLMTDEEILKIELGNYVGPVSLKKDAGYLYADDVDTADAPLNLEGIVINEENVPDIPPNFIDVRPLQVPHMNESDNILENIPDHPQIDEQLLKNESNHVARVVHPLKNDNDDMVESLPDEEVAELSNDEFFPYRLKRISFLRIMDAKDTRSKFIILVDYSLGMFNRQFNDYGQTVYDVRWAEAKMVVTSLIDHVTRFNDIGISLHFFSDKSVMNDNVRTAEEATALFDNGKTKQIKGALNFSAILKKVLDARSAFEPMSVLIVTGGSTTLEKQAPLIDLIVSTDKELQRASQLKLSFVQVGDDEGSTKFLQDLRPTLIARGMQKDIVDVTTHYDLRGSNLVSVLGYLFNNIY